MGNLRQSMTDSEWEDLGRASEELKLLTTTGKEPAVDHPHHYGGKDNPYEVIKIIDAYGWGYEFALGNAIKYILRAGKKHSNASEDLEKASWYLNHVIEILKKK